MNRIPLALMTLPFLAWCAPAARWQWLNPRPTGNNLIHVFAKDAMHGIVVAENGEVAETSDAGATWTAGGKGGEETLLIAATTLDGVAILGAGVSGSLWKTTNAGHSWRATAAGTQTYYGICHMDAGTALAVGEGGVVMRSGDSGNSWEEVHADTAGRHLFAVHCGQDGFSVAVGSEGYVLKSLDGGRTWKELPAPAAAMLSAVAFYDPETGFAAGENGLVLKTGDGGLSWTIRVLDTLAFFRGLRLDGNGMSLAGTDGQLWKSENAGADWTRVRTGTEAFLAATARFGTATEIAVGNGGMILQSTDGGTSWSRRSRGSLKNMIGMEVLSPSTWVAFGMGGLVMRTYDAGASWTEWTADPGYGFLAGAFHGDRNGLLSGYNGIIMRTEDGGDTWAKAESGFPRLMLDGVAWADSSTAVVVGEEGSLLRSTDVGKTWKSVSVPGLMGRTLSALRFLSPTVGLIAGYGGLILKTTDAGATWSPRPTPSRNNLFSLSFLNEADGMAAGYGDTVLVTHDGGDTWSALSTGYEDDLLYGVSMVGPDTAIVTGEWLHYAIARLTTDGGKTWSAIPNATNQVLNGVVAVGPGKAVALGGGGAVLLADLRAGAAPIHALGTHIPLARGFRAVRLGTSAKIRFGFSLPNPGRAAITRFSADGRMAGTLFNGFLSAGTHAVEAGLPTAREPGLYRLTMTSAGGARSWYCSSED